MAHKICIFTLLIIYLQGCCGLVVPRFCVPTVIEDAKGGNPINPECPELGVEEGNPLWYASLPFAIPIDIMSVAVIKLLAQLASLNV